MMLPGAEHTVPVMLSVGARDAHHPVDLVLEEAWELGGWGGLFSIVHNSLRK